MDAVTRFFLTRPRFITWHTLPQPEQFWVRNSEGDEMQVEARSFNTIRSIKVKLLEITGRPPDQQALVFGKDVLEDNSVVARYNIWGRTIRLVFHHESLNFTKIACYELRKRRAEWCWNHWVVGPGESPGKSPGAKPIGWSSIARTSGAEQDSRREGPGESPGYKLSRSKQFFGIAGVRDGVRAPGNGECLHCLAGRAACECPKGCMV